MCDVAGRSPYGERGLKFVRDGLAALIVGRSPYGERGLKLSLRRIDPPQG